MRRVLNIWKTIDCEESECGACEFHRDAARAGWCHLYQGLLMPGSAAGKWDRLYVCKLDEQRAIGRKEGAA